MIEAALFAAAVVGVFTAVSLLTEDGALAAAVTVGAAAAMGYALAVDAL